MQKKISSNSKAKKGKERKASVKKMYREIEVRFLEVPIQTLKQNLATARAQDLGERLLEEVILYDEERRWVQSNKRLRLRTSQGKTHLSYKHHQKNTATGTQEIEVEVGNEKLTQAILEQLGFIVARKQQKRRHTFLLDGVTIDIDTWPTLPAYVELEGESEKALKQVAQKIGLNWNDVVFESPRTIIVNRYNVPLDSLKCFTFETIE